MRKSFIIGGIIIAIIVLIFSFLRIFSSPQTEAPPPDTGPVKHLNDYESIEGAGEGPDIRFEELPDGRKIEYGSPHGKLSPLQEEVLKKIIEDEKNKTEPRSAVPFFLRSGNAVFAAGPVDNLVINPSASTPPVLVQKLRNMFAARSFYWTDRDLAALSMIIIVDTKNEIDGALGAWNFIKIRNTDNSFAEIKGVLWLWKDGPIEEALIHEYGHHYTNYWAALRTNGQWEFTNIWPPDPAGDYYALRPLRDGCWCAGFKDNICPYTNRVWEIIAEDYRATANVFNTQHMFARAFCANGSERIGQPDLVKTAAYLAALPLTGVAMLGTPTPVPPTPTPGGPAQCLGVQHCTKGSTVKTEMCGNCQGVGCTPGYLCTDPSYTCITYQQKMFATDTLYSLPCAYLTPTPRPPGAADDVGFGPDYFPRVPFASCYNRGGVCTHQESCLKFNGTVFEKNTTVCPTAEGCCVFPNPKPIAPTQTPCEREAGICTDFPVFCTAEGGRLEGAKGCPTQCCKFPKNPTSYTYFDYQQMIKWLQEDIIGPMAISAWLQHACRIPSLQSYSCDPTVEGSCERLHCVVN